MQPEAVKKLIDFFMRLPGIGPRQASRFVSALLDEDHETVQAFSQALHELASSTSRCSECFQNIDSTKGTKCAICQSPTISRILVIEKDQDLETIAKSGAWDGAYHVLGGTVAVLNEKSKATERIKALYHRAQNRAKTHPLEIVLATSATTEGDATAMYIERVLEPLTKELPITISHLARGISTGTDMEFVDPQTLKNAIKNRK